MHGQCVVCLGGVPQLVHPEWEGTPAGPSRGVPQLVHPEGGPLPCSILGGSTSMITSRGSHVTYPIMLLYTTIECPSASWTKFTWDFHGGVPCDLSHYALDITSLLSRHQLMGLAWCSCLYTTAPMHHGIRSHGTPQVKQTDWQTNTTESLPSCTMLRVVKISREYKNVTFPYLMVHDNHWHCCI